MMTNGAKKCLLSCNWKKIMQKISLLRQCSVMFIHCLHFPESNTFHAPPFSLYNVQCTCKQLDFVYKCIFKNWWKILFFKGKKSKRSLKVNKKTFEFAKENVLYKYSTKPNFLIIQTKIFVYSETLVLNLETFA